MIGAVIGDIIGSRFERFKYQTKSKDFDLFTEWNHPTDDSVFTLAVAQTLLEWKSKGGDLGEHAILNMREIGHLYPHCGYGKGFKAWVFSDDPMPYNSWGNGAAMRVSACGVVANSLEEAIELSRRVTEVTHNHPEGIKGAEATTVAVFGALNGWDKAKIRQYVHTHYYPLNETLDEIRAWYHFDVSCQGTVPQSITAFLESSDYEDTIRGAISIGGDSDTIAAIAGGIAGAYYGIPSVIREGALTYLDSYQTQIVTRFEEAYPERKSPSPR